MPPPDPSPPAATPRRFPWRRLFQFRLRTLLIVTAIIAIALGWWSYKARQQRAAEAAILRAGGSIRLDEVIYTSEAGLRGRVYNWMADVFPKESFDSVWAIDLHLTRITDTDLTFVDGLTTLKSLNLGGTRVTDAGLEHVGGLSSLQELDLDNTEITDAGLAHLKGLTALQTLYLNKTKVTDAGVARLQKSLPNCKIERSPP